MVWSLIGCVVGGGERSFVVNEPVEMVEIALENGEVHVVSVDREGVLVEWEGGGVSETDLFSTSVEDGVLVLDADCDGVCGGELYVEVPPSTDLCVQLAAGEAALEVEPGGWDLDLDVGAGELSVVDVHDDPDADRRICAVVAAGELSITGVSEEIAAD